VWAHSRRPPPPGAEPGTRWIGGDLTAPGDWQQAAAEADVVVHLAGAPIARGRWNAARKQELRTSRIASTQQIVAALAAARRPPSLFVCASATGYYGARGDEPLDEGSGPGDDFLARLCVEWEAAAANARQAGVRVVSLRLGAVLSRRGGALAAMRPVFRWGLGGSLGPADRYFPWIHEDDATGLIEWALRPEARVEGALNAVAPEAVRMGDFARCLAGALGRPAWIGVPGFALRWVLGELGASLAPGQHVVPRAALDGGYAFRHPRLDAALSALLA
jgi:uncharacterized protein (TIGR01777 family)